MKYIDSINHCIQQLKSYYHNEMLATQYAWWLFEAITSLTKAELITKQYHELTPEQHSKLKATLSALINDHKPIQYIIGTVPFGQLTLLVRPPTLIPRPETEEWCMALIQAIQRSQHKPAYILDMCTGSGCIALALARAFPESHIYAVDICLDALALAQENAARLQLSNITFMQSDLFAAIPNTLQFDLIVANPPYISHQEWLALEPSVRLWENKKALIASDSGNGIVKKIIQESHRWLAHISCNMLPQLVIEVGFNQADVVRTIMHSHGFYKTHIGRDCFGNNRIVIGKKDGNMEPFL